MIKSATGGLKVQRASIPLLNKHMTTIINRHGVEQTIIDFSQSGRDEVSCTLSDELLDGTKSYNVCVEHWSIPAETLRANTYSGELFTIFRRNQGELIELPSKYEQTAGDGLTFTLRQYPNVQAFVGALRNFARGFKQRYRATGLAVLGVPDLRPFGGLSTALTANAAVVPPLVAVPANNTDRWIDFTLESDGTIQIHMTTNFVNNFVIRFTSTGRAILSIASNLLSVTHDTVDETSVVVPAPSSEGTHLYLAATNNQFSVDFLSEGNNAFLPGQNTQGMICQGRLSLFQTFDTKLRADLESHLPVPTSISIEDGIQKNKRSIAEVYFAKSATITSDAANVLKIATSAAMGQYTLIKKTDPKTWHKLRTSYNLRFFRFHQFITYREWSDILNKWVIKRVPLALDENTFGMFTLRFVSSQ
jgi:hypothetical protein